MKVAAPPRAAVAGMRLAELIGSLSHALDLTEGQPKGHCVRACWIGVHVVHPTIPPETSVPPE